MLASRLEVMSKKSWKTPTFASVFSFGESSASAVQSVKVFLPASYRRVQPKSGNVTTRAIIRSSVHIVRAKNFLRSSIASFLNLALQGTIEDCVVALRLRMTTASRREGHRRAPRFHSYRKPMERIRRKANIR